MGIAANTSLNIASVVRRQANQGVPLGGRLVDSLRALDRFPAPQIMAATSAIAESLAQQAVRGDVMRFSKVYGALGASGHLGTITFRAVADGILRMASGQNRFIILKNVPATLASVCRLNDSDALLENFTASISQRIAERSEAMLATVVGDQLAERRVASFASTLASLDGWKEMRAKAEALGAAQGMFAVPANPSSGKPENCYSIGIMIGNRDTEVHMAGAVVGPLDDAFNAWAEIKNDRDSGKYVRGYMHTVMGLLEKARRYDGTPAPIREAATRHQLSAHLLLSKYGIGW